MALALFAIPAVQKVFNIIPSAGLEGYFVPSLRPAFTFSRLITGEYQQQMAPHLDKTVGFHNELTRLINQCDYSFFSVPHAARIIVGKNDLLHDEFHINAYLGKDFIGERYIDDKVARLKYLQEFLLAKKGVTLVVILAPGKGCYYPDHIPDRLLSFKKKITNDEYYSSQLKKSGVNLIDFNQWFVSQRDTTQHVLYPKTGVHWSSYGAWLCADSLTRYLEALLDRPLPHMILDSLVQQPVTQRVDNDMDRVLNLMWRIPVPMMTYPVFHHLYQSTLPKPAALFISDSFYWNWHNTGIIKNTFRRAEMWYYDKDVYPMQLIRPTNTAQIDLDQAISRQDVVVLLQTNAGYGNLGNGFVDRAYEFYYPGATPVKKILTTFRSNTGMMDILKKKAEEQHLPLESVMMSDAIYLYNKELKRISKHTQP